MQTIHVEQNVVILRKDRIHIADFPYYPRLHYGTAESHPHCPIIQQLVNSFIYSFHRCLWTPRCWAPWKRQSYSHVPSPLTSSSCSLTIIHPSSLVPPRWPLSSLAPHCHLAPSQPIWHSPLQGLSANGIRLSGDLVPHGQDDGPLCLGQRHGGS